MVEAPLKRIMPLLLLNVLVPLVRVKLPAAPIVPAGAVNELLARTVTALRLNVPPLVTAVLPPNEAVPEVAFTVDPEPTVTLPFTVKLDAIATLCKKFSLLNVGAIAPEKALGEAPAAKLNVDEPKLDPVPPLLKFPARSTMRLVPPSLKVPADTTRFLLIVMSLFSVSVLVPSFVRLFKTIGVELVGSSGPGARATLFVYCTSY